MKTLALILGDQLDPRYLEALELKRDRDCLLMVESRPSSEQPASHIQRSALFLSAMRHYARDRIKEGWSVIYRDLRHPAAHGSITAAIPDAISESGANAVASIQPGSWATLRSLEAACGKAGIPLRIEDDSHFLSTPEEFESWAEGRKTLVMEYFYREQRRRHDVLVDENGKPEGGSWNFDKENRKNFRSAPKVAPRLRFRPDKITKEVLGDLGELLPELPGSAANFCWPVTRRQSL
ncbi:MAG TPA: cryptochrome/photolyase family protein, partial [Deltaproteobacteria bacterium]|nr:cryptochrome/photolyase family protein [Deltaproteobacteria bacterium]